MKTGFLGRAFVFLAAAFFLLVLLALACVTRLEPGPPSGARARMPRDIVSRFAFAWPPLSMELSPAGPRKGHPAFEGRVRVARPKGGSREVVFEYWPPKGSGPAPAVSVIPILEGGYDLVRLLGAWFQSQGFAVVMVHRPTRWLAQENSLERLEELLRRGVSDQRLVLRWLASRPEIDSRRLYTLGISLGAILGADLAAVEPHLDGTFLVMAGGDLPDLLGSSIEPPAARYRAAKLRESGEGLRAWEASARRALVSDPLALAPYVDPERVSMVLSRFDRNVPTMDQLALRKAMGDPPAVLIPTGHYTAALYWFLLRRLARDFFRARSHILKSSPR